MTNKLYLAKITSVIGLFGLVHGCYLFCLFKPENDRLEEAVCQFLEEELLSPSSKDRSNEGHL